LNILLYVLIVSLYYYYYNNNIIFYFLFLTNDRVSSWAQLGYSVGELLVVPNVVEFTRALNALVSEFEHDKNESTSQKMVSIFNYAKKKKKKKKKSRIIYF